MMWIPLRSAKMNRRILGFQRRVWCPKWTPAASSASSVGWLSAMKQILCGLSLCASRRDSPPNHLGTGNHSKRMCDELQFGRLGVWEFFKRPNPQHPNSLSLAELESLSCLRTSRLLALDRACVAREQAEVAQLAAVAFIDLYERASNSETQRARLTGLPAALEIRLDVVPTQRIRRREWLLNRAH